jgi:hypothetical protein
LEPENDPDWLFLRTRSGVELQKFLTEQHDLKTKRLLCFPSQNTALNQFKMSLFGAV